MFRLNYFRKPITTPAYGPKNSEEQQRVRSSFLRFNCCLFAFAIKGLKSWDALSKKCYAKLMLVVKDQ